MGGLWQPIAAWVLASLPVEAARLSPQHVLGKLV